MSGDEAGPAPPPLPPTPSFPPEVIAAGERLMRRPWSFLKGVVGLAHLPDPDRVEIAFAGRSNVGKSSLINALVDQKGLARTSNTPGRTQELNFFAAEGSRLYIVDMPGYGYAKAPKARADAWNRLVRDYLRGRQALARVFVLIDARHGVKAIDEEIMGLLDQSAVSYQLVLTKADKIGPAALDQVIRESAERIRRRPAAYPFLLATAAATGHGIPELRAAIAELLAAHGG